MYYIVKRGTMANDAFFLLHNSKNLFSRQLASPNLISLVYSFHSNVSNCKHFVINSPSLRHSVLQLNCAHTHSRTLPRNWASWEVNLFPFSPPQNRLFDFSLSILVGSFFSPSTLKDFVELMENERRTLVNCGGCPILLLLSMLFNTYK